MSRYSRRHLADSVLIRRATANAARDHAHTAELLADLGEIDARKLYLPAACPSMLVFCVRDLDYSEDEALKRIRVARVAREFPAIFESVSDGRLSLTAVIQLAPHLTAATANDLIAAAAHRSKIEIQRLIAERFPRPDVPTRLERVTESRPSDELVPEPVAPLIPQRVASQKPDRIEALAPQRHALQLTIDDETRALLETAQRLLSHQLPLGDVAGVIKRALQLLVPALERTKFAATDAPRVRSRDSNAPRHIPAHVKRAVWVRDGGQCTFVSDTGRRCPARTRLEFDHVLEVARGGLATVDGMRLRCRAHNQYTAECTFGAEFMKRKRDQAREEAARAQASAARARQEASSNSASTAKLDPQAAAAAVTGPQAASTAGAGEAAPAEDRDVTPWLRRLGFRADDLRRAAAYCEGLSDVSLEDRVRAALCYLRPRVASRHGERFMPRT